MVRSSWANLLKGLAAIFCIVGLSWLALEYFVPSAPSRFSIATGGRNQIYEAIGKKYREVSRAQKSICA